MTPETKYSYLSSHFDSKVVLKDSSAFYKIGHSFQLLLNDTVDTDRLF